MKVLTVRNVFVGALLLFLALVPVYSQVTGNVFLMTLFTRIVILAIAAVSLNLINGLAAGTIDRYIGLWVDRESPAYFPGQDALIDPVKIGAIGVRISRWVTMHGFALNLRPELRLFGHIVPCGIRDHGVSSVHDLAGAAPSVREAAERALVHLTDVFGATAEPLHESSSELWDRIGAAQGVQTLHAP